MVLIVALLLTLPLAHFFAEQQRKSKERVLRDEEERRLELLEAILKNSKDKI